MQPFMETRVPISLGGVKRTLVFNVNTMCAYEEATGKFFLDTVASLYDAMAPALTTAIKQAAASAETGQDAASEPGLDGNGASDSQPSLGQRNAKTSPFDLVRKVPMRDLRALLWAALHEYDQNDEPTWPLTLNQVGRMLGMADILPIFTSFLKGQSVNQPSKEEMGESLPAAVDGGASPALKLTADGGDHSIELPASAFA